jgi:hypothetical protein
MSEKHHPDDNVSFLSIKRFIQGAFEMLFDLLSFIKSVFINNKLAIVLGVLTSLLLGYAYFLTRPKFYKASMIVQYNNLSKKTYAEILDQLDQLVRIGSDKILAENLNIHETLASKMLFVEGRNLDNNLLSTDLSTDTSTKLKQPIKVVLGLTQPVEPRNYEEAIISYLNNGPYLKRFREEQRKIYVEKLNFIEEELRKIDTLERQYNRFLANPGVTSTFYNNAFNPAEIYVHSLSLLKEKEFILRWLNIDENAITILDGFKSIGSPASISFSKSLLVFGAAGLVLIFSLAFLKETKRKLSRTEKARFASAGDAAPKV